MWFHLIYYVIGYVERHPEAGRFSFNQFADYVFEKAAPILHYHDRRELKTDLKILSNLGIISFDEEELQINIDDEQLRLMKLIIEGFEKERLGEAEMAMIARIKQSLQA
jgi:hypothetical protein